jgi:predicted transglutaminase-like cysteine proteinase
MRKFIFASAAALAMAASGPALAKSQNNEAGTASAEAGKGKAERKICRTLENSASRMKAEKVCLTKEQWRKFDAAQ